MTQYKINEFFETIQGEGQYTGTASIFIRLQGCPVGCSWCDTKHTWDVNDEQKIDFVDVYKKSAETDHWGVATADDIYREIVSQGFRAKHVVITGGEPAMYDLNSLCDLLHSKGYSTQIETSGTFELMLPAETWVTVSPKINMSGGYKVLTSCMARANEIKHPIARQKHVEELEALLEQSPISPNALIYLQPISQKNSATELAIETCKDKNWRLSVQVHKYIGIE
jgi:7-carboxy-7-deazaguanine synthase